MKFWVKMAYVLKKKKYYMSRRSHALEIYIFLKF